MVDVKSKRKSKSRKEVPGAKGQWSCLNSDFMRKNIYGQRLPVANVSTASQ
jgi:hypothetical protein